jgi:hypothetical protein
MHCILNTYFFFSIYNFPWKPTHPIMVLFGSQSVRTVVLIRKKEVKQIF